MNIVFLCAEIFESEYPEQAIPIYKDYVKINSDIKFNWVFRSKVYKTLGLINWRGDNCYLCPILDRFSIASYFKYFYNIWIAINRIQKTDNISAFHVFDDPVMGLVAYIATINTNIKLVYQVTHLKEEENIIYSQYKIYGGVFANHLRGKLGLNLRNWILRRSNLVFSVSQEMKDLFVSRYKITENKIKVVPAGINCNIDFRAIERDSEFLKQKYQLMNHKIFFYMGTLNRIRKLEVIFYMLSNLSLRFKQVKLMILNGNEADKKYYLELSRKLNIDHLILFVDTVPRQLLYSYIAMADICLAPYFPNIVNNCNSPVKTLEYQLLNKFTLGTNIPSQTELLNEIGFGSAVNHHMSDYVNAAEEFLSKKDQIIGIETASKLRQHLFSNRSFEAIAAKISEYYLNGL